jgi:hypothetical protein
MLRLLVLALGVVVACAARAGDAAVPPGAPPLAETRVLVVDFLASGAEARAATVLADDVALHLQRDGRLAVATIADVRAMLRVAGDRQLLGCVGEEACMAGVGGVLEARHVVRGSLTMAGGALVLTLAHLDTARGAAPTHTSDTAADLEGLRRKVPLLVDDLVASLVPSSRDAPGSSSSSSSSLRTRADGVWAAVRAVRARERGGSLSPRRYVARFDGAHFAFDAFDRMRKALPLSRRLLFPGEFPSCLGRTEATQDSFVLEEGRAVALPVERALATELEGLRKDRKLSLELTFEVLDARLQPLPPPDPVLCRSAGVANLPELAPEVTVRITGGVVVDELRGRRIALGVAEAGSLSFQPLPEASAP